MTARRRDLLILGGGVAFIYGLRALPWDRLPGRGPRYVDIAGLPPFRRLGESGPTSAATASLIGLDPPSEDADLRRARAEAVRTNLCGALFGDPAPPGTLPIAYFSEFQCPYCRALERDLDALLEDEAGSVRLIQHELPIFGPASELVARASVAAARQGRQQALRRRFMRMPLIADMRSIRKVAGDVGLDADQLARDMASPEVQAELDRTRALADLFGFIGTPGLVVGRTVLKGTLPYALLRRIVEDERSMPAPAC